MSSPHSPEDDPYEIDPSEPFKGVIVCCTSIPPDQRTDIAQKVAELGGVHKYDLTPDVTHLIVGEYNTPKYRHVARERVDIKAMDAAWIDAVNEPWKNDEDMDFFALERAYQLRPFETCGAEPSSQEDGSPAARGSLLICLTGFGDQRDEIAGKIVQNGGRYTGDLTRRCSHLIVNKPEGKKFTAAKSWNVLTVTLDWLDQSVERGMILEETRFDPLLPQDEQGVGAWVKKDPKRSLLGKRSRSAMLQGAHEDGTRKLRKTASMKLSSQRNNLWGDILGRSASREYSFAKEDPQDMPAPEVSTIPTYPLALEKSQGIFADCVVVSHGFPEQRKALLEETISIRGGTVVQSVQDPLICSEPQDPRHYRFLIVPQTSQPDTHPQVPNDCIHVITELYVETCLQNQRLLSPGEVIFGRPFPMFPIPGFSNLTVCSTSFTGIELNHVARSVVQLGGKYEEAFRPSTSVLICKSLESIRKDKLKCALEWGVPIVSIDWLLECVSTGYLLPIEDFVYTQHKKRRPARNPFADDDEEAENIQSEYEPKPTMKPSRPTVGAGVDTTAFDHDSPEKNRRKAGSTIFRGDSITSADFMTARTHQADNPRTADSTPLSELSSAALNKSPRLPTRPTATRTTSAPTKAADIESQFAVPGRVPSVPPQHPEHAPEIRQLSEAPDTEADSPDTEADSPEQEQDQPATPKTTKAEEEKSNIIDESAEEEARKLAAAKAELRQGLKSALSGLIEPSATSAAAGTVQDEGRAHRRRHKILGRAVSNASNASSATSADNAAALALAARAAAQGGEDDEEEEQPPPTTQLEYRDPEAMESKAILMSKMAGGEPSASGKGASAMGRSVGGRSLRRRA